MEDGHERLYRDGDDEVEQNYSKALKWYIAAAEQGDVGAQVGLGTMYAVGKGIPQDFTKAASWFLKAAKKGNTNAQIGVGNLYASGKIADKNYVDAYAWISVAVASGDEDAARNRDKFSEIMSKNDIQKAKELTELIVLELNKNNS